MSLKISELPVANAIQGTELLAVVQGGSTKRTTIADVLSTVPVDEVGYIFRRKAHSHYQALSVPESMTHPQHTVQKLRELGFNL